MTGDRPAAYVRVREALRRLEAISPVSEVIEHGAVDAAEAAGLDRVLLSQVHDGVLLAEALHIAAGDPDVAATIAKLRAAPRRSPTRSSRARSCAAGTPGSSPSSTASIPTATRSSTAWGGSATWRRRWWSTGRGSGSSTAIGNRGGRR